MKALVLTCVLLLSACSTTRVEYLTPKIDDLAVLPVRPVAPSPDTATQRDVARFIIDLSAYADALEAKVQSIMEAVNGTRTDRRRVDGAPVEPGN